MSNLISLEEILKGISPDDEEEEEIKRESSLISLDEIMKATQPPPLTRKEKRIAKKQPTQPTLQPTSSLISLDEIYQNVQKSKDRATEQKIEIDKARGFLTTFFSWLSSPEVIVGTPVALYFMERKNTVRELVDKGEIKLPESFMKKLNSASNDELSIESVWRSAFSQTPQMRIGVATPDPDKPKKMKMEYVTVDYSSQDLDKFFAQKDETGKRTRLQSIFKQTLDASVATLAGAKVYNPKKGKETFQVRPRPVYLPSQGAFGKRYASMTGAMGMAYPKGHPLHVPAMIAGFGADVVLPGPGEALALTKPLRGASKIVSKTKFGDNLVSALYNKDIPRAFMKWFGIKPKAYETFEDALTFGRSKIVHTSSEFEPGIRESVKSMMKDVRKAGKKQDLRAVNKQTEALLDWMLEGKTTTSKSYDGFVKGLKAGKTPEELFTIEMLSEITGKSIKQLERYPSIIDMRVFYEALEEGTAKGMWSQHTVEALRKVIDDLEVAKVKGKIIPEERLWEGSVRFVSHQLTDPSTPVKKTFTEVRKSMSSQLKRTHDLWKDFEKAVYLNPNIGDVPQYNVLQAISREVSDTFTTYVQKLGDDILAQSKDAIKVVTNPKLRKLNMPGATKAVEDGATKVVIGGDRSEFRRFLGMMNKRKLGKLGNYRYYAPVGHLKFYVGDVIKRADLNYNKLSKTLKPDELRKVNDALERLGNNIAGVNQKNADAVYNALDDLFSVENFGKSLGISKNVPAYLVESSAYTYLKDVDKQLFAADSVRRIGQKITRWQTPFMKYATVYNFPRFWQKFMITDVMQMYLTGGVPGAMVPFRIAQGAKIKAGKGMTHIVDDMGRQYDVPAKYIKRMYDELGIGKHTREITTGEANNISTFVNNLWGKGKFHHTRKEMGRMVQKGFTGMDDSVRFGTALHEMQEELIKMTKGGKEITKEMLVKAARLGAKKSHKAHYNYSDLPAWVKQGVRKAAPFISWWYHVIPDMVKAMTKFHKMHGISTIMRSAQTMVGIPDPESSLESKYMAKSYKELKFMMGDQIVYVDLALPYKVLDFDKSNPMGQAFRLAGPILGLALHGLAGLQTYPHVQPYGKLETRKVDAPVWIGLIPKQVLNKLYRPMGLSWRIDFDTGQKVMTMDKRALDVMSDVLPWTIPVTSNTRSLKLRISGMKETREMVEGPRGYIAGRTPIEDVGLAVSQPVEQVPYFHQYDPKKWLLARANEYQNLQPGGIFILDKRQGFHPESDPWKENKERARAEELYWILTNAYEGHPGRFSQWVSGLAEEYKQVAPELQGAFKIIE